MSPEEYASAARRIVLILCGRRWTSPPVSMTDRLPLPASGTVFLSGRPVRQISSVETLGPNAATVDPGDYDLFNGFRLQVDPLSETLRAAIRASACDQVAPQVDVTYTYGVDELPDYVQLAIDKLASEMEAADSDSGACKLPERVTNVTRQGVSWTLLDPQDFLEDGRTGIYEVDLAIKTANPSGARARSRVFTTTSSAPANRRTP